MSGSSGPALRRPLPLPPTAAPLPPPAAVPSETEAGKAVVRAARHRARRFSPRLSRLASRTQVVPDLPLGTGA